MAILWDSPLVAAAARELTDELADERVRAVHVNREDRVLTLFMDAAILVFDLHPTRGWLLRLPPRDVRDDARSLPVTFLRARVDPDERILVLELQRVRGSRERIHLVVELMTNQWNAVQVDVASRRVEWSLHPREAGDRELAGGAEYRFPEPSDRRGRDEPLSEEEWLALLEPVDPGDRRGVLLREVAWTSALNADALLGGRDGSGGSDVLRQGHRLWLRIRAAARGAAADGGQGAPGEPVVLHLDQGLQPYPIPLPDVEHTPAQSVLDAMEVAAGQGQAPGAVVATRVLERARRHLDRLRGKVRGLERELDEAPDPEALRGLGDLILARFHEIPRGRERAVVEDFEGNRVELELDPAAEPQENASRYYDEAGRAERAKEKLPAMISEARERAERVEEVLEAVEEGEAEADELARLLPDPRDDGGSGSGSEEKLPYRRYRSSGGLEIRVGRGAKSNDDLTFHHSAPDDVWLHARQAAGAHVILRWQKEDKPPARDLAEAAVLAALASKARTSGSVPVSWTRRKYVRKPRKAPPGAVLPDRVQTVFVKPDPRVEERLRIEE